MADITAELIEKQNIGNNSKREPNYLFYVSDVPYRFQSIGEKFLGRKFSQVKVISL